MTTRKRHSFRFHNHFAHVLHLQHSLPNYFYILSCHSWINCTGFIRNPWSRWIVLVESPPFSHTHKHKHANLAQLPCTWFHRNKTISSHQNKRCTLLVSEKPQRCWNFITEFSFWCWASAVVEVWLGTNTTYLELRNFLFWLKIPRFVSTNKAGKCPRLVKNTWFVRWNRRIEMLRISTRGHLPVSHLICHTTTNPSIHYMKCRCNMCKLQFSCPFLQRCTFQLFILVTGLLGKSLIWAKLHEWQKLILPFKYLTASLWEQRERVHKWVLLSCVVMYRQLHANLWSNSAVIWHCTAQTAEISGLSGFLTWVVKSAQRVFITNHHTDLFAFTQNQQKKRIWQLDHSCPQTMPQGLKCESNRA